MSEAQRNAITLSSIETQTCWPLPVRSRASSAAVTAWDAVTPVSLSGRMVRTSRGLTSSEPACTVVSPEIAWISGSYTGRRASGPRWPKPEIET